MTAAVNVKADEDDPESQDTGWFRELCVLFELFLLTRYDNRLAGGVARRSVETLHRTNRTNRPIDSYLECNIFPV